MFDRLRRHPLLSLVLLLSGLGLGGIGLLLWNIDLDAYRSRLDQTLEETLDRPVQLGDIRFSLRGGLVVEIDKVAIGAGNEALELHIDHLRLRLRLLPLFQGQLAFSRLLLDQPHLQLRQRPGATTAEPQPLLGAETLELLRRTRIERLTIQNGTVTVETMQADGRSRRLTSRALFVQLRDLSLNAPISLTAQGELVLGHGTVWQLNGTLTPPATGAGWDRGQAELQAELADLRPAELLELTGLDPKTLTLQPQGSCDLKLRVAGSPASGVALSLALQGKQLQLSGARLYDRPLAVNQGLLTGIWRQTETANRLEQLQLDLDDLTLTGSVDLPHSPQTPRSARFVVPATPLTTVARYLPDRLQPELIAALRAPTAGGSLTLPELRLQWGGGQPLQLASGRLQLHDGHAALPRLGAVHAAELDLAWQERTLELRTARARLLGGESTGQGHLTLPVNGALATSDLRLKIAAEAAQLVPLLPQPWQQRLQLSGPLELTVSAKGTRNALLVDTVTRFAGTSVAFDHLPLKAAEAPGELLLVGTITPQQLEFSHARLQLPWGAARANGVLALDASGRYRLAADLSRIQLAGLPELAKIQHELAPRGTVDLHVELAGDATGLQTLSGSGEVAGLGLALWQAVADVRDGTALFKLDRRGLYIDNLTASIGDSPLRAKAALDWTPAFRLILDIDLPKARASDLIFRSRELSLEKIQGRLVIDTHGIRFQQLQARIKDGTAVVVDGRLADYAHPAVVLDIQAPRADIAEIIALWHGPHDSKHTAPSAGHDVSVHIAANVERGTLYDMRFEQAKGTIVVEHGRLTIQPLTLRLGNGQAQAQIATGRLADDFPLLRVSGSVEGVDADRIHNELLKRQGFLSGALNGDFYLQGELGRYLPSCSGGLAFTVRNGTLRGYPMLARVFSLLNVSQLLSLKLPDMTSDGIPFNTVSGTVQLQNGVLRTEDLKVDSEAINLALVGSHDMVNDRLDFILGAKPLRTVDKILSSIPLAGWILTGEQKALITAQFRIEGSSKEPKVTAIPITSVSDMVVGILRRTLGLPAKVVNDVRELFQDEKK